MKKKLQKIKCLLSFFALFVVVGTALGYDNLITHPQISVAATEIFQGQVGKSLTQDQIWWIKKGSIDEDAFPRYSNHYYDPTTGKGLDDIDELLGHVTGISAKAWAQNQSGIVGHTGDYSVAAILENYRIGNKSRAYEGIGHILHLIQDMSVPAHTRNDAHSEGDPYENWAKQNGGVDVNKANFISVNSLDQAFDDLALYSHNNFFSKSSIKISDTNGYEIIEETIDGIKYKFLAKSESGEKYRLCLFDDSTITISCKIDNGSKFNKIHLDYWNLLYPKATGYSAGVIDYFIKQFELIDVEKQNQSFSTKLINSFTATTGSIGYMWGDAFMSANEPLAQTGLALVKAWNSFSSLAGNLKNLLPAQLAGLFVNGAPAPITVVSQEPFGSALPTPVAVAPVAVTPAPAVVAPSVGVPAPIIPQQAPELVMSPPVIELVPVMPPIPVIVPPSVVAEQITEVTPTAPAPVYRGSGSVTGISPDALAAQNNPAPQSQTESADTGAFSTSTEEVLLEETATTTDSTATSTDQVLDDIATTTDPITTEATSTEPILPTPITDFKDSIVINEIAWMGTKAETNDEWIELYNKTDQDIDLSGWALENKNKTFSVTLAHSISARGYFLLERTASSTTDVVEDMIFTGALNNSGPNANLYLKNGSTTIDSIDFSGKWPAGDNGKRYSMERVSAYATSTLAANWKSYGDPDVVPYAKDAKGDDIFGTPGRKNSMSGFYTPTGDVAENMTWKKEYSPYLVSSKITIKDGVELDIEPGIVVKFANTGAYGGSIDVQGVLRAEGTSGDPITFTSVRDDDADAVDSGRDGATIPASGDWLNLIFSNPSRGSVMRHAEVRYGGQGISYNPSGWYPTYTGVVSAQEGALEISDSHFSDNAAIALYASKGSAPKIYQNNIENTTQPTHSGAPSVGVGIMIDADASAEIVGNTLKNNRIGIRSESVMDAPVIVKDNRFDSNTKNGEFVKGYANWNLENSGNEDVNNVGGFEMKVVINGGQEKTIHADAMPYVVVEPVQIFEGGRLSIEPGTVMKFKTLGGMDVDGVLSAVGTEEDPIVFTAFADDSDGYDSNSSPLDPAAGMWKNIVFTGAASSDSVLKRGVVRYAGQGKNTCPHAYLGGPCMEYEGAVGIDGADPTITHSLFENNLGITVFIQGVARPTITHSEIRDTQEAIETPTTTIGGYGISIGPDSEPTLEDNTYANNAEDVVYRE